MLSILDFLDLFLRVHFYREKEKRSMKPLCPEGRMIIKGYFKSNKLGYIIFSVASPAGIHVKQSFMRLTCSSLNSSCSE